MATTKSAIRECRDQLFLDRADGDYLSRVGSNLSMDRPALGFFSDELWRAVVRRGAVDYRQIANLFRDVLDIMIGPRTTVVSVLSQDVALYDDFLMVTDPKRLPQRGTVVFNEGLPTAISLDYSFIDPLTGKMEIDTVLTDVITADLVNAKGTLLADALTGSTSLTLRTSEISGFPTSSFPKSLILDAGTDREEVVQLTAHASPSAPLTVSATSKDHYGPTASPITTRFVRVEGGDMVLFLSDTSNFPGEGLIRLVDDGYGSSELVEYYDNNIELGILYLRTALVNTYTTLTTPVTLMVPGSTVQLAQLQVKGIGWGVYQTQPRKLQIYIPKTLRPTRELDGSYLHGDETPVISTTLASAASIGDTSILVSDASTFPMAGALTIDSESVGYSRIDRYATRMLAKPVKATGSITTIAAALINDGETFTLNDGVNPPRVFEFDKTGAWTPANARVDIAACVSASDVAEACVLAIVGEASVLFIEARHSGVATVSLKNFRYGPTGNTTQSETVSNVGFVLTNMTGGVSGIPIGTLILNVEDVRTLYAARDLTRSLVLGRGTGTQEVLTWASIDLETNMVTLDTATTAAHSNVDLVEVNSPNRLYLNAALASGHLITAPVTLDADTYSATDLEIGDPRVSPASVIRYHGRYLSSPADDFRKMDGSTTLSENVAGPVMLLSDAPAGYTALEVLDGVMFDATGAFSVTVGRKKGSSETVETSGVVLRGDATTLTTGAVSAGDTIIPITVGTGANFPQPPGGIPYGYRVIMDTTGVGVPEVAVVQSVSGDNLILNTPLLNGHTSGVDLRLLHDVIMLSNPLTYTHDGLVPVMQKTLVSPGPLRDANRVHLVEELRTHIEVGGAPEYPSTGGKVILNFGSETVGASNSTNNVLAPGDVSVPLKDSSGFPASDFMVSIGSGFGREFKHVSTNNTGTNTLTLSVGVDLDHSDGTEVEFEPGDQIELEYTSTAITPDRLIFADGVYLPAHYQKNVSVTVRGGTSEPSDYGTDYPLILPADWDSQLSYLINWGRAAGVQVVIISDK